MRPARVALPAAGDWCLRPQRLVSHADAHLDADARAVDADMFAELPEIPGAVGSPGPARRDGGGSGWSPSGWPAPVRRKGSSPTPTRLLRCAGIPHDEFCFVGDKAAVRLDLIVDDAPVQITAVGAAGRHHIIYDHPYNRYPPGVRARTWVEVVDLVAKGLRVHDDEG